MFNSQVNLFHISRNPDGESLRSIQAYRSREAACDLIPLVGSFAFSLMLLLYGNAFSQVFALYGFPLVAPLIGASWMHFAFNKRLLQMCGQEFRESLALTGQSPQDIIRAQLIRKLKRQRWLFVISILALIPFLIMTSMNPKNAISMFMGFFYPLLSLQLCAWCIGLVGICSRLRRLCRPNRPPPLLGLLSAFWLAVTWLLPATVIYGAILLTLGQMFAMDPGQSFVVVVIYCATTSTFLNAVCLMALRRSWRKLLEEYFQFE